MTLGRVLCDAVESVGDSHPVTVDCFSSRGQVLNSRRLTRPGPKKCRGLNFY